VPQPHFTSDALLRALACGNQHCLCHRSVSRGQGLTHCPAHDDQHPSLSVSVRQGTVLWNCKAGCDQRVVTAAVHAFFPLPERTTYDVKSPPLTATRIEYDYGLIPPYGRVKHVRIGTGKDKRMWWEPRGVKMADVTLWNGDLLRESRFENEPVLLVEGEKDANRGVMFGFCCVSLPGGAAQRDYGAALNVLGSRDVVLIPDSDPQGTLLMQHVALHLVNVVGVRLVKVLYMPPASHDLSDFLDEAADADPRGARVAMKDMIELAEVFWRE
jgi:hypothetical protein